MFRLLYLLLENPLRQLTYNKLHLLKKESFANKGKGFSNLLE